MMSPKSSQSALHNEHGFTLVELLVVIAIIAVLTAIAVPIFLNQRKAANDAALRNDLKNAHLSVNTVALEEASWRTYIDGVTGATGAIYAEDWNAFADLPHISLSDKTVIQVDYRVPVNDTFCLIGRNAGSNYIKEDTGNATRLFYDPILGGIVTKAEITNAVDTGQPSACSNWKD